MKIREPLGTYIAFPKRYHYAQRIMLREPPVIVQRALLNTLHKLNGQKTKNDLFSSFVGSDVEVILEIGVANGFSFDYLNMETLTTLLKAADERGFRILDFICIVRYYRFRDNKRVPLRFDFFLLRFLFNGRGELKVKVFHERGLQRIPAEYLVKFLLRETYSELTTKNDV